jgi:uncharacterized protein (TIGR03086 family)
MTEVADRYRRRADAFATLIDRTTPQQWSNLSPCEGWLARDVVAHVVDYAAHVLREQAAIPDPPEFAGRVDPAKAFQATRQIVEAVLDDPNTSPEVAAYIDLAVSIDLPQHGWDLAVATGQDASIDQDELEWFWESLTTAPQVWDWQRQNGWYGAPVPVPDDAPLQDRVLGLLGRDPAWRPPAQ